MNPTSIMAIAPYAAGQAILGIAAQYGKDYLINKADQYADKAWDYTKGRVKDYFKRKKNMPPPQKRPKIEEADSTTDDIEPGVSGEAGGGAIFGRDEGHAGHGSHFTRTYSRVYRHSIEEFEGPSDDFHLGKNTGMGWGVIPWQNALWKAMTPREFIVCISFTSNWPLTLYITETCCQNNTAIHPPWRQLRGGICQNLSL